MSELDFSKLHVLIVDDEAFMREILVRIMHDLGVRNVVAAANGEAALEKCRILGSRLSIVICDLEMPIMSGLEFVRLLRAEHEPVRKDVPVLIVTGHSESENVKQAISLGIHGFVVKPISPQVVKSRMLAALSAPPVDPNTARRL
jgi:two-component system chemotaxis response regulator CheY